MLKRYGLLGCIRLIISLGYTKLNFPKARLIRLPFDVRNKRFIKLGDNFTSGFGCRLEALEATNIKKTISMSFGSNVQINDYVHIAAGQCVKIGNNVLIASKVFITDINHGIYSTGSGDNPDIPPNQRSLSTKPVVIDDNVWLGENVCVMPGVTIGFGCIIGAGAVVTKNIPSHSIAVGNPAKVIKTFKVETQQWELVN